MAARLQFLHMMHRVWKVIKSRERPSMWQRGKWQTTSRLWLRGCLMVQQLQREHLLLHHQRLLLRRPEQITKKKSNRKHTNKLHSNFKNQHLQAIMIKNKAWRWFYMAKYQKKLEDDIRCPLEYGLAIFGGKWKSRIICVLSVQEKLRYSEVRSERIPRNIIKRLLIAWWMAHIFQMRNRR